MQRDLFPALRERVAAGAVRVCELSTMRNLERYERPSARFLIAPDELAALLGPLELVYY